MEVAAPVHAVSCLTVGITEEHRHSGPEVIIQLSRGSEEFIYLLYRASLPTLSAATDEACACMWAWTTGGGIGLVTYLQSKPDLFKFEE